MKRNLLKRTGMLLIVAVATLLTGGNAMAQQKVADKELVGVWVMESMQWKGEEKTMCGVNYAEVKIYGPNGEYAHANFVRTKEGKCVILPQEYGTYSFKNGIYSEMGVSTGNPDALKLVDKNTFTGVWMGRHDVWKKCRNMPKELKAFIVEQCKAKQQASDDIQQLIKKTLFK